LGNTLLHGKGAEVDKHDPELLRELDALYKIIKTYDHENVSNMDESGLFFRTLPRYTFLMPDEDMPTVRGKKKAKDRVSLVICANATGSHNIPCALIAKAKKPAFVVG